MFCLDLISSKELLESIPDPAAILNVKCQVLEVNDAWVELFGYSREEIKSNELSIQSLLSNIYPKECMGLSDINYTNFEMLNKNKKILNIALTINVLDGQEHGIAIFRDIENIEKSKIEGRKIAYKELKEKTIFAKFGFIDFGPVPETAINTEHLENYEHILNRLGVYYMTTIQDNLGLFGPFPVIENPNLRSMVYKYEISAKDAGYELHDDRLQDKVQSMIVIIYDEKINPLLSDHREIRTLLQNIISQKEFQTSDLDVIDKMLLRIKTMIFEPKLMKKSEYKRTFEQKLYLIDNMVRNLDENASLENSFEEIINFSSEILDYKYFTAWVIDRYKNVLNLVAQKGYTDLNFAEVPLDKRTIMVRSVEMKQTQNIADVSKDSDYFKGAEEIASELAVPIFDSTKNRVLGVLNIENDQVNSFSKNDEILLEQLAEKVSSIIEKDTIEKRFLAITNFFTKVHELKELKLEELFNEVCKFGEETFSERYFAVMMLDRTGKKVKMAAYRGYEDDISELTIDVDEKKSVIAQSIRESRSIYYPNVYEVENYKLVDPQVHSELVAPILVDHNVVGIINLESYMINAFSKSDIKLLEALANIVGSLLKLFKIYGVDDIIDADIW